MVWETKMFAEKKKHRTEDWVIWSTNKIIAIIMQNELVELEHD